MERQSRVRQCAGATGILEAFEDACPFDLPEYRRRDCLQNRQVRGGLALISWRVEGLGSRYLF
jgi:hypothetical protein